MNDPPASRFARAIAAIDAVHTLDPRSVESDGLARPHELLYALRITEQLVRVAPDASEALCLAARGQHLRRWQLPRDAFPLDRVGYLRWRTELKSLHAAELGKILIDVGYDDATIARAQAIVKKDRLKSDPETQALEDAVCLVFLAYEAEEFAAKHPREKVLDILRKTWPKMSAAGHELARRTKLPPAVAGLVAEALTQESADDSSSS